jgi:lipoprotein-releasing system ATP-binding protein
MNNTPLISLNEIYKTYSDGSLHTEVIKGISLEIKQGEVVVIMGPSGVGKSTLLHILGGLDLPTRGQVIISGHELTSLNSDKLARFRNGNIGFVFQFHHLLPEFTALENVLIPLMMYQPVNAENRKRAADLLAEVGLSHRLDHKPNQLSGGEQQRVAVARALINQPAVLLADEPTGNLDKHNSSALYKLMLDLNNQYGQTLVMVTHNEEMCGQANRVLTLDDGRIGHETRRN